jgi:hypothetical protein
MRSVMTRRRVRTEIVRDELGRVKHLVLTTHRNNDIEITVDPNRPDSIDITKRPTRLTVEQSRCEVAILQHAQKLLATWSPSQ